MAISLPTDAGVSRASTMGAGGGRVLVGELTELRTEPLSLSPPIEQVQPMRSPACRVGGMKAVRRERRGFAVTVA